MSNPTDYLSQQVAALREGKALGMTDGAILQWVMGLADTALREQQLAGLDPDEFDALFAERQVISIAPEFDLAPMEAEIIAMLSFIAPTETALNELLDEKDSSDDQQ